jgi:uncharacterized protein
MVEQSILEQLGYQAVDATLDEKAEVLFMGQLYGFNFLILHSNFICSSVLDIVIQFQNNVLALKITFQHDVNVAVFRLCKCSSTTAVVLGSIFGITSTFRPFSDDIFRYGQNIIFVVFLS